MEVGRGAIGAGRNVWRWTPAFLYRRTRVLSLLFLLSACAGVPPIPYSVPPALNESSEVQIQEPEPSEVVVVVNNNTNQSHAGMFVGSVLADPAGSYFIVRGRDRNWPGASLKDYTRFQLEDGPDVRLYRFKLTSEALARLQDRVEHIGFTPPLFCAAKVQNLISGIPPFQNVPDTWLVTPAAVGQHLDRIIRDNRMAGVCNWPDGSSCYAVSR